uniref:Uncharacterized protein n=1 Tax=Zea mays TaxID=4577 RepID=A0A804QTL1_MAIZE
MKCLWKTMYYPLCSQSLLSEELIWIRMPLEPSSQNPSMQIAVIRHVVSGILLHNTIYDVVPLSSKLTVLDTQLPVKQAFKIMHDVVCMLLCLLELLQIVHFPSMVLVCSHFNFALFLLSF